MYLGRIVELGPVDEVFYKPLHPYTQALLNAVPTTEKLEMPKTITGEIPSMLNLPKGCYFAPRCPYATEKCKTTYPELKIINNRIVACHLY